MAPFIEEDASAHIEFFLNDLSDRTPKLRRDL